MHQLKATDGEALPGDSGCGKTTLMNAINGPWPYGRGDIFLPAGVSRFYAAQEVKLPPVSLKQLACLPDPTGNHADAYVAAALHKAGLGEFIEFFDEAREGSTWDQLLSGGQKQRLVLARIVLHRPGLLFLTRRRGRWIPNPGSLSTRRSRIIALKQP